MTITKPVKRGKAFYKAARPRKGEEEPRRKKGPGGGDSTDAQQKGRRA